MASRTCVERRKEKEINTERETYSEEYNCTSDDEELYDNFKINNIIS